MKINFTSQIVCFFILTGALNSFKCQQSTWTILNKTNSGLPSDTVNVIVTDNSGNKWIGTENGLAKYNGTTWTIYKTSNSGIPSNKISCITFDSLGNKWVGTRGGGAAMFDGTTWTVFNSSTSLVLGKNVGGIAIDSLNNKWIVSNMLTKLGPTNQSLAGWSVPYCSTLNNQDTVLNSIVVDRRNIHWIGSTMEGVYFCQNFFGSVNIGPVSNIVMKGNDVWFGTDNGFLISDPNTTCGNFSLLPRYPTAFGLATDKVSTIAFDNCGYAWIGTKTGGVLRYNSSNNTGTLTLTASNSPLPSNNIKCIASKGNEKWIGTTNGIALLNTGCQYNNSVMAIAENEISENEINIFPNPSSGPTTVFLPGNEVYSVSVVDCLGSEVLKIDATNRAVDLHLDDQAKGIYFICAKGANSTYRTRLIKE